MRHKFTRLIVIFGAFVLATEFRPAVGGQAPNCDCWGTISSGHFIWVDPLCQTEPYNWSSYSPTALGCHNWCLNTINFVAPTACETHTCPQAGGLPPSSWSYDGYVRWNGTPFYINSLADNGSC